MSQPPGAPPGTLVLRLSVPAEGTLRPVAWDIAAKLAEYLGDSTRDAVDVAGALEAVAARVAPPGGPGTSDLDLTFEFRQLDGELLIVARCGSRASEVRCPLPA
jgi:hypothetical protein